MTTSTITWAFATTATSARPGISVYVDAIGEDGFLASRRQVVGSDTQSPEWGMDDPAGDFDRLLCALGYRRAPGAEWARSGSGYRVRARTDLR